MQKEHIKFKSIDQYYQVIKRIIQSCNYHQKVYPIMTFVGTVKLHGSNASIVFDANNNKVYQSRNRILSEDEDHMGFVSEMNSVDMIPIVEQLREEGDSEICLFGEWIGPGVQKKIAISELPEKQFVLFSIWKDGVYHDVPDDLDLSCSGGKVRSITEGPTWEIDIDVNSPSDGATELEKITAAVEDECPWGALHGIEGVGEGVVWKWKNDPSEESLWFKTKGEKHAKKKTRKVTIKSPEQIAKDETTQEIVELELATVERMQQGWDFVKEQNGFDNDLDMEMQHMGPYLKFVHADIIKENVDLLEQMDVELKGVMKLVQHHAKKWFINNHREALNDSTK